MIKMHKYLESFRGLLNRIYSRKLARKVRAIEKLFLNKGQVLKVAIMPHLAFNLFISKEGEYSEGNVIGKFELISKGDMKISKVFISGSAPKYYNEHASPFEYVLAHELGHLIHYWTFPHTIQYYKNNILEDEIVADALATFMLNSELSEQEAFDLGYNTTYKRIDAAGKAKLHSYKSRAYILYEELLCIELVYKLQSLLK